MFLQLANKRKHADNYVKQKGGYHWTAGPVEQAEHRWKVTWRGTAFLSSNITFIGISSMG